MGEWGGTAAIETFWLDLDGDGLGSGDGYDLCNGLALTGWVTNGDDADDACASNIHDECDVCDGDNSSCADCAGTPNGDAYIDNCDVCDSDSNNDCVQDCAGTWGGTSVDDQCGICGGDDTSCADLCGVPNGDDSSCADECGVPNGDNSSCADCAGTPNGSALVDLSLIHI